MSRIDRREFAKRAAVAVVLAPSALGNAVPGQRSAPENEGPKPEPAKLKLTDKQEEEVKKATERRNQTLASMRNRALPYDLEPAFVFAARPRSRPDRKPGTVR